MDANRKNFLEFMYDVFDSLPITKDGIFWVCKTYVMEYIWSLKTTISEAEFVNLLNDLQYLISANYEHITTSNLSNFRSVAQQQDDIVYNIEVMLSFIKEYQELSQTVTSNNGDEKERLRNPYGDAIEFRECDRAGFYKELLALYKLIGVNKEIIHNAVKEWLNEKILPKVQKNEMSSSSLVLLTDVIDQVEKEYEKSIYRVLEVSALSLMEDCKFNSLPWLCYGDIVDYIVRGYKLHPGSAVEFMYEGNFRKGKLIGVQTFNEELLYIVQSEGVCGAYNTVIVREVIPC